jgi:hypothetical protein
MNKLTREIAEWLNVDLETALRVQNHMAVLCGSRFSQDSTSKLKKDARTAYASLQAAVK